MAVKGDRAIWEAEAEGVTLVNTTIGEALEQQAANRYAAVRTSRGTAPAHFR